MSSSAPNASTSLTPAASSNEMEHSGGMQPAAGMQQQQALKKQLQ